ncbi:MAG: glycosyltransferase family 4 protein [Rheinheimera sp.]|nr:glycosyltransferase family 4 protein [Rheinheimera sp.]
MKLYVIYRQFYVPETGQLHLGGIENYILALSELFLLQGYQVIVLQPARQCFVASYAGIEIRGIDCRGYHGNRKKLALFQAARQDFDRIADWLIFATDSYFVPSDLPRSIAIQHGVSWDKPGKGSGLLATVKSWLLQRKYLSYVRQCRDLVCVDHNFINWYRTLRDMSPLQRWTVIPNFCLELASHTQIQRKWPAAGPLRLLIARRFVDYRGIPLASRVVQTLLQRYPQLQVSFAGDGPLLPALQQQFADEPRVRIFCYEPAESLMVHMQHHLVLLPSVGSEGTSLSLAEAMAAGCAVVTTNVGGLSNMVLDQHNGLICMPDEAELVQRLSQLIEAPDKAEKLALMAWQTAQQSFSKSRWQQDWLQVLANIRQRSAGALG